MLVGLAINFAIKKLDEWIHANERAIEAANELSSTYQQTFDKLASNLSTVEGLETEFEELSKGVDQFGNNISLDTSSYERYRNLVNELVEINPELVRGYDAEGNAIIDKNNAIEETIRLLKEQQKQEAHNAVYGRTDGEYNHSIAYEGEKAKYKEAQKALTESRNALYQSLLDPDLLGFTNPTRTKELTSAISDIIGAAYDGMITPEQFFENNSESVLEHFPEILKKLGDRSVITQGELAELTGQFKQLTAETENATRLSEEFTQYLFSITRTSDTYDLLDTTGQNVLSSIINSFDSDILDSLDDNQLIQFVHEIPRRIAEAAPDVQSSWQTLLSSDSLKETLSTGDYISAVEDALKTAQDYLNQQDFPVDIDLKAAFKLDSTSATDIQAMLDSIQEKLSISAKFEGDDRAIDDFMEKIEQLPVGDLTFIYQYMLDDIGTMSIDELLAKLSQLKTAAAEAAVMDKLTATTSDLEKQLKNLNSAEADYVKIADTVNGRHKLTDKEVVELCTKYADLQDSLSMTSNGWTLESGAMDVVNNSLTSLQQAYITSQQVMNEVLSSGVKSRLEALGLELEGITSVASAYSQLHYAANDTDGLYAMNSKGEHIAPEDVQKLLQYGRAAETANNALEKLKSLAGKVSTGSSGDSSVEKYLADIDELYHLMVLLTEAQEDLADIQRQLNDLADDDYTGRIALVEQEITKTQEINDLLHQQNELRDSLIHKNIAELEKQGFKVNYNDKINYLEIENMEHLNELKGKNTSATNDLIKKYEELINTTIELNDANKENSASWQDNASAVKGYTEEIKKLKEEMFDAYMAKWDDFFKVRNDFDDVFFAPGEKIDAKIEQLGEIIEWYEKGIISAEKFNEAYNEIAKDIYDIQLDSLNEILDMVEEMIRQEDEDLIDAYEKQKDLMRDIIDMKKESLKLTERERGYNQDVNEKIKEIAKLQARIDQLSLDDSRDAQAERASLLEELAKRQAELAELQNDHSLELQEDALDKEYDNFEDNIDKEIDAVQDGLENAASMHQRVIEYINDHWDTLYSELVEWNSVYGTGIENDVKGAWENALTSLEAYRDALGEISVEQAALNGLQVKLPDKPDYVTSTADDIVAKMWKNSQSAASRYNSIKTGNANADSKLWKQDSVLQQLSNSSASLGAQLSQILGAEVKRTSDGVWYIDGEELFKKYGYYHIGGIVGRKAGDIKDNEMFTLLEEGEAVLTKPQQSRVVDLIKNGGLQANSLADSIGNGLLEMIQKGAEALQKLRMDGQQQNITVNASTTINGTNIKDDKNLLRAISNETCNGVIKAFRKAGLQGGSLALRPN